MIFTRMTRTGTSAFAVAGALFVAMGGLAVSPAFETPAAAKEKKGEEKAPKANYSKEFIAAYKPLENLAKAETPDVAAMQAAAPAMVAAVQTDDDKMAAGNMLVQIGQKAKDNAMQLQGLKMMLDSGKLPADRIGLISFAAGQLEFQAQDYAQSRAYLQKASDAGYGDGSPQALIAETYFQEKNFAQGLKVLGDAVKARETAGEKVDENWLRRGLAMAYNNKMDQEAASFAFAYAKNYPSEQSWGDAVAVVVNSQDFDPQQIVDLYRLGFKVDAMRTSNMYREFIQSADPQKLPNEVIAAIDAGIAAGKLEASNAGMKEARAAAQKRIQDDKKDLPAIARDARAASAKLTIVMAAADAFLDYDRFDDAIEMYNKALGMPGADQATVLTRLGIAQTESGKYQAAEATFDKVQGKRASIARLWKLYAEQKAKGGTAAATPTEG